MTRPLAAEVAPVFASWPVPARRRLLALRELVFDVADATPGVGPLSETLKWGEPAYLTEQTRAGTTLRLAWKPRAPNHVSLFVHCGTSLVDGFRALDPELHCIGDRELRLAIAEELPASVRTCVEMTLTYHRPALARQRAAQR